MWFQRQNPRLRPSKLPSSQSIYINFIGRGEKKLLYLKIPVDPLSSANTLASHCYVSRHRQYKKKRNPPEKHKVGPNKGARQHAMASSLSPVRRRAEEFYLPCPVISLRTVNRLSAEEATEGLAVLSTADAPCLRRIPLSENTLQSTLPTLLPHGRRAALRWAHLWNALVSTDGALRSHKGADNTQDGERRFTPSRGWLELGLPLGGRVCKWVCGPT